jgi:hypothetical protein
LLNSGDGLVAAVAFFHVSLDIFIASAASPYLAKVMGALLTITVLA